MIFLIVDRSEPAEQYDLRSESDLPRTVLNAVEQQRSELFRFVNGRFEQCDVDPDGPDFTFHWLPCDERKVK
jgi:hypothetical protein